MSVWEGFLLASHSQRSDHVVGLGRVEMGGVLVSTHSSAALAWTSGCCVCEDVCLLKASWRSHVAPLK